MPYYPLWFPWNPEVKEWSENYQQYLLELMHALLSFINKTFLKTAVYKTEHKINFFSDSHLAPKFFKVVANSKKVGHHFQRQTKPFFMLSVVRIDPPKLS